MTDCPSGAPHGCVGAVSWVLLQLVCADSTAVRMYNLQPWALEDLKPAELQWGRILLVGRSAPSRKVFKLLHSSKTE